MRKLFLAALCCTAILLITYTGYRSYKTWKQRHLISMARTFISKGDSRNAMLSVSQALKAAPWNVEACRLMAELAEAERLPNALAWRSRVVELDPKSVDDRLALAKIGMARRDFATATNALEGVSPEGKKTVAYHNIAGAVASSVNRFDEAKAHFSEAIRLDPQNPFPQLNLAVVQISGTNQPAITEGRVTLQRLSANPTNSTLRTQALRELVIDSLRYKQNENALAFSKTLLQQTNASFEDRLLRLEALQRSASPEFKTTMIAFEHEASTNSAKIYELSLWQQSHGAVQEGLTWLQSLPPDTRTNQPVALLVAESLSTLKDWPGLQRTLEHQNWSASEFIRHAFLARALRAQELTDSSKGEWGLALKTANDQKASLVALLRLASQWGWQSEGEELLWSIVNRYPDEKWAGRALSETLYAGGRTRSLLAFYSQEIKRSPTDLGVKNNLAMTALLLGAQELKPHDLAREVYEKSPTNFNFASTYAFSLYVQKKNDEALKILQQLKPETLGDPGIAGYYGLVLQATGNSQQANKYLDLTSKSKVLPEERKLFDQARTKL